MNSNKEIYYLVCSMILNETYNLSPPAPHPKFDFLGGFGEYVKMFNQLHQENRPARSGYQLPWDNSEGYFFWRYYCGKRIHGVSANSAAKRFVPFRRRAATYLDLSEKQNVSVEAFHYPYGVSAVITVRMKLFLNNSLSEVVEKTQAFRLDQRHRFDEWANGLSLRQLGSQVLEKQRKSTLGDNDIGGVPTEEPFTIATVIQGSPAYLNKDVIPGGEIHRALEGLSTWRRDWDTVPNLPDLQTKIIPTSTRTARANHLIYGDKSSRVIWFPAYFNVAGEVTRKLSCYHRNLVFASMQTMSLGRFLHESVRMRNEGTNFSSRHRTYIRKVKLLIDRLDFGLDTYRSGSVEKQIDQNRYDRDKIALDDI